MWVEQGRNKDGIIPDFLNDVLAILKEDLSCSWPINSFKLRGRAKFKLLFVFSSGIFFESTILSSFLRKEKSLSPTLEEIIAIMKG